MKNYQIFLLTICLGFATVKSFTITSAEVSGDGKDETKPAKEGGTVSLRCLLSMNNEVWEICQWYHVIPNQYDSQGKEMAVKCTGLSNSNGQVCTNAGGHTDLNNYASRIKMEVSQSTCGISISNAHPSDTGKWECRVHAGQTQFNNLDLFVSNHSIVNISDPQAGNKIEYSFASSRPEIRATCRGFGGKPQPTFQWFVNEDRYPIRSDLVQDSIRTGSDPILGNYVYESITFTPTADKLCNEYGLSSVCRQDTYTFKLICKTYQDAYYTRENADARSEATVEVRNGTGQLMSSIVLLIAGFSIYFKLN